MKRIFFNIQRAFNVPDEELKEIIHASQLVFLEKNEFFLHEGEVCQSIGFIERGSMRLFYESPDKEVCNDFFFENSAIGSLASFLSQTPSIVNIAAIEKCELLLLGYDDVMALIEKFSSLKRFSDAILQDQLLRAERREAALLRYSPEQRFRNLMEEHPKVFKRIPLHYIASYLGIKPETLSRYRAKLLV